MNWFDFIQDCKKYRNLHEWQKLERLLAMDHPLIPGEREQFLELLAHTDELGHPPRVQLDSTGLHVIQIVQQ